MWGGRGERTWNDTCRKLPYLEIGQEKMPNEEYPGRLKKMQERTESRRLRNKGVLRRREYPIASNATERFKSD